MVTKRILIGKQDLNYLHENWPKGQFIHITKVAEILQKAQVDGTLGLKVFDRRKKYSIDDKILVLIKKGDEFVKEEVEIYTIEQRDVNGEFCQVLRTKPIGSKAKKGRTFVSNDKRNRIIASTTVTPDEFAVSKSNELIPELIIRLKSDMRFVSFEDYWIPKKDIDKKKISKFDQTLYSLLTRKTDFETLDIVERLDENSLITSNYLLSRFQYLNRSETKKPLNYFWSCAKKLTTKLIKYHLDVNNNRIKIDNSLESFLAYNGLTQQAVFQHQTGNQISTKINLSTQIIESKELFQSALRIISNNKAIELSSKERSCEVLISPIDVNVEWTMTTKDEWINSGTLRIGKRVSKHLTQVEDIEVQYDEDKSLKVHWDSPRDKLVGLQKWYKDKKIKADDRVHLKLISLYPPKLRIWTEYERDKDSIIKVESEDHVWDKYDNKQCIYWILNREERDFHYREIYNEVKKHKNVSIKTIIGQLYHNSPELFIHSRNGFWHLSGAESDLKKPPISIRIKKSRNGAISLPSEVRDFIVDIEQRDLVHKILEITGYPLSFHDICAKILEVSNNKDIAINQLRETGFLNESDERLQRLESNEWGLTKWLWRDLIDKEAQLHLDFKSISNRLSTILN
ncbi:hypothetical protein IIA28_06920 [candidate division KSB1 bacterium]|nr:hypothetical protein [candidate division KSB1 bacterium]